MHGWGRRHGGTKNKRAGGKDSSYCVVANLASLRIEEVPSVPAEENTNAFSLKTTLAMKRSNFEKFVRGKFLYIYWRLYIEWNPRYEEDCVGLHSRLRGYQGWFCRKHLSYKRFQPLHTPHNVVDYIPTPILTWPFVLDIDLCIPLFRLHTILPKLLGCIESTANTNVKHCLYSGPFGVDQTGNHKQQNCLFKHCEL